MAEETGRPKAGQRGSRPEPQPPDAPRGPRAGGLPPHLVSAVVLVLFAPALFVACYCTNEAVDEDGGGTPVVARPTATSQPPTVQPTPTPSVLVENVGADDDPFWGPQDASVTIVEFSDFQCPYCARFFLQTYPQVRREYEGKVKFIFRDFPLTSIHQYAEKAAEAAGCANDQGKFWEYHDLLWTKQQALDVDSLKSYAADLGLDTVAFDDCLDSGKHASEVQKDVQDGRSYGVGGTPAFLINGQLVSGAVPFADFKAVIDAALQGRQPGSVIPSAPGQAGGG